VNLRGIVLIIIFNQISNLNQAAIKTIDTGKIVNLASADITSLD
jgi:hypothetical protein